MSAHELEVATRGLTLKLPKFFCRAWHHEAPAWRLCGGALIRLWLAGVSRPNGIRPLCLWCNDRVK